MIAAIVAAAMSTLSSSLNSSAASTVGDFSRARPTDPQAVDHDLGLVRWITAGWALVQATVALVAIRLSSRVVDEVLGIQSFTGGLVLGLLTLAVLTAATGTLAALSGLAAGTTVLLAVRLGTDVSWQWYALIGSVTTVSVGVGVAWSRERVRRLGARP